MASSWTLILSLRISALFFCSSTSRFLRWLSTSSFCFLRQSCSRASTSALSCSYLTTFSVSETCLFFFFCSRSTTSLSRACLSVSLTCSFSFFSWICFSLVSISRRSSLFWSLILRNSSFFSSRMTCCSWMSVRSVSVSSSSSLRCLFLSSVFCFVSWIICCTRRMLSRWSTMSPSNWLFSSLSSRFLPRTRSSRSSCSSLTFCRSSNSAMRRRRITSSSSSLVCCCWRLSELMSTLSFWMTSRCFSSSSLTLCTSS
mmetsp:Transcript_9967/g.16750  ORF Transcript_9967/g.16750 Transcript_9967/m.16750 type:complete len:257 (+) Transcript_9967:266-1036(+)